MDFTIAQTREIHKRIKALTGKKKMKMKDFYKKSGISSSLFSQYGTGRTPTSILSVNKMADALEIDVSVLLEEIEKIESPVPTTEDGLSDLQQELIRLVSEMTDGEVSVLLASAKAQLELRKSQGSL